jgi:hypothetical protein
MYVRELTYNTHLLHTYYTHPVLKGFSFTVREVFREVCVCVRACVVRVSVMGFCVSWWRAYGSYGVGEDPGR